MSILSRLRPHDPADERRRQPRLAIHYPVKVWCVETGRYLSGRTRDVSAQGVLVELQHPSLLVSGQRLRVGIAWSSHSALVRHQDMIPGQVVRSLGHGSTQNVAISFDAALSGVDTVPLAQSA